MWLLAVYSSVHWLIVHVICLLIIHIEVTFCPVHGITFTPFNLDVWLYNFSHQFLWFQTNSIKTYIKYLGYGGIELWNTCQATISWMHGINGFLSLSDIMEWQFYIYTDTNFQEQWCTLQKFLYSVTPEPVKQFFFSIDNLWMYCHGLPHSSYRYQIYCIWYKIRENTAQKHSLQSAWKDYS